MAPHRGPQLDELGDRGAAARAGDVEHDRRVHEKSWTPRHLLTDRGGEGRVVGIDDGDHHDGEDAALDTMTCHAQPCRQNNRTKKPHDRDLTKAGMPGFAGACVSHL